MKRANCARTGSFRPSSWRSRARSSMPVSNPTIWWMGSPTKRNSANAISDTTSITSKLCSNRRMINVGIGKAPLSAASRLFHSGFLSEPIKQYLVIRPLHDLDGLRRAPDQGLLVQWNIRGILVYDAERLGDEVVSPCGIKFDQDAPAQVLDLRIAVATQIILPATFAIAAANDVDKNVARFEGIRRPTQEVE